MPDQPKWAIVYINGTPAFRQCPLCAAMVASDDAQQIHQAWHDGERMRNFSGF